MNTEDITAFAGMVVMELATWDTDWGMYVRFQIPQMPEDVGRSNPFKRYTKMRKGKVGTRFHAVIAMDDDGDIVYDDEIMLKGWGDGINGWKVTFWVDGYAEHPFLKFSKGAEFSAVLVELQSDNEPVNQTKRERLTKAEARKRYPIAMLAGQLCKEPKFIKWLMRTPMGMVPLPDEVRSMGIERVVAKIIKDNCRIESRRELDTNPEAAEIFHDTFRRPYVDSLNI